MKLWKKLKTLFATTVSNPLPALPVLPPALEPDEAAVPEVQAAELRSELTSAQPPTLLDVREPYEWRQVHITQSIHIPMNEIPARLAELPRAANLVVICAHGSRSYGVAHYLITQGYEARSLAGGITAWQRHGGAVVVARSASGQ